MKKRIFILGWSLLLTTIGFAQTRSSEASALFKGDVYAIVVGISQYRYIKPLSYADKDAELFADLLRSGAAGRIKEENLVLLKNDSANAGNFWSALSRLTNKNLKKGDRVFIYYAGHGDGIKGLNEYYLLLSDCQPANDGNNYLLSFSAIDMYRLKNRIGLLIAKGAEVVLVLDACRTNELAGGYASQVFNSSIIQTRVGEIAMLATGPGQVSIEDASFGRGHGLFTYNLVDAMSGYADNEDGNNDRIISLYELNNWVSKKVKLMSLRFRVKQEPVFCCDEKNNTPLGRVDSSFSIAWNQLKRLAQNDPGTLKTVKTQRGNDLVVDSNLLVLYNKFNSARKESRLWGDSSANDYYDQMAMRYNNERMTEDARYALAADMINFAQQKINLYLEGKDQLSVDRMRDEADSANTPGFLSDEYDRMRKTVSEKWTITALMIQKAGKLLSSNNDSTLLYQLKPRINFLLARGYLAREKENKLSFEEALQLAMEAYRKDSTAAYTAECLGLIHAYRYSFSRGLGPMDDYELGTSYRSSDTSMQYFKKAIRLAPNWVSPYRSIGLKVFGVVRFDSAIVYLHKAIELNPTDPTSSLLLADMLRQHWPDSALYYYRKAMSLSGRSAHAAIYRKMAGIFLISGPRNSPFFKPDSVIAYSNLALSMADGNNEMDRLSKEQVYRDIYLDIASVYNSRERYDSALMYYMKVIRLFPDHEIATRSIANYFINRGQLDSGFFYYNKLLQAKPDSRFALSGIARYYDTRGKSDSAIFYFKRSLVVDWDREYSRERIAYLIMATDKHSTEALGYFNATLQETPYAWRSYYNIARFYANQQNTGLAIEYLEKAMQRGMKTKKQLMTDSYFAYIRDDERFKNLVVKYLPD